MSHGTPLAAQAHKCLTTKAIGPGAPSAIPLAISRRRGAKEWEPKRNTKSGTGSGEAAPTDGTFEEETMLSKWMRRVLVSYGLVLCLSALSASPAAAATGSVGPFMANFRLGPAIAAKDPGPTVATPTQFSLELEFGYAVLGKRGYVLFSPTFQLSGGTMISVPVGFSYDFAIPGVKGLFFTPRITLGYTYLSHSGVSAHGFLINPSLGIKYMVNERFQVGFEPFSLPIVPASVSVDSPFGSGPSGTFMWYRIMFYAGMRF